MKIHKHGFIHLIGHYGDDQTIANAARVSYTGQEPKTKDRALLRYLMRHKHTSPFEMVMFQFHVKVPIFVARQWMRHRTGKYNEQSGRYVVLSEDTFLPDTIHYAPTDNKQGRGEVHAQSKSLRDAIAIQYESAKELYHVLLSQGVCPEQARMVLPVAQYTEFVFEMDQHNLLHFLKLRLDPHAQKEIRDYAEAILTLIKPIVPLSVEAWEDYSLNSYTLSREEVTVTQEMIKGQPFMKGSMSDREVKAYKQMFGVV